MPTLLHGPVQGSLDFSFTLSKPSQLLTPDTVTKYRWRLLTSSAHIAGANPPGRASWCVPDSAVHRTCWSTWSTKDSNDPFLGRVDTAPHAENLVLRAAPPPHWADPQGRADTPASKKRTNLPNVFPSKAVRLSYKKWVFIPLLLSTTYSGGPCLHVSVGHSPFVQPSQRHHGVHQPSPQDTVALSKRNPLALPIPQVIWIPCCLLTSGGVQSTRSGADPYCQSTVGLCMATKGQFNEQGGCSWSWCLWLWSEEDEEYQSLMVLLGYYLNIGQMFADCSAAFGK